MKKVSLIFIFLLILKGANAITFFDDSTKTKYELNDPRNPNCPCHKYQKLAEEEFKLRQTQQNGLNKIFVVQKAKSTQTSNGIASAGNSSGNSVKTKHFKNLIFSHHKNKSFKIFNFNKGPRGKKRHFVCTNKSVSSCFRWR
ncbi:MAG: hypothetical protein SFY56_03835 [Bacteroidota bacterium]|nr:hypothetical protein [Bacteroidota bacterium]